MTLTSKQWTLTLTSRANNLSTWDREDAPSASTWTSNPRSSRSRAVCWTHTCVWGKINFICVSFVKGIEHPVHSLPQSTPTLLSSLLPPWFCVLCTSIPNSTTDFRLTSCFRISSTSGITMEKTVLENTRALLTSISETVLPSPGVCVCVCSCVCLCTLVQGDRASFYQKNWLHSRNWQESSYARLPEM